MSLGYLIAAIGSDTHYAPIDFSAECTGILGVYCANRFDATCNIVYLGLSHTHRYGGRAEIRFGQSAKFLVEKTANASENNKQ
jgi:hypothetical protein